MKASALISLLIIHCCCCTEASYEIKVVVDLIKSFAGPKSVVSATCWSRYEKVQFVTALADDQTAVAFTNTTDITVTKTRNQHIVFVLDFKCFDVWIEFMSQKKYTLAYRWVILETIESHGVRNKMDGVNMSVDTEVMIIDQTADDYFDIYYLYRIDPNGDWIKESYGQWSSTQGLVMTDLAPVTAARRRNLCGYELRVCYVLTNNDSINHLTDGKNDYIDTLTKVNYPTTNHLIDFLNATRKYVFTDSWGYKQDNKTWNGMSGYLSREEVDIGGTPMFFTSERLSFVEYISSPTPTRGKFVFQQPKLSYENNLFLLPFQASLWYGSLALILLLFLVLFMITVWEWKRATIRNKQISSAGVLRPNVIDVALLTFGATCQQGSQVELKSSLGRMVLLLLFVALTFLYTSFSANIVALLQSSSSDIKTLADLLNSRIKFGVHDTVFNRYYFSTETEPIRRAIYTQKVAPAGSAPRFMSMEDGVKQMRKGLFAFHMEIGVGYKFVGKYFEEGQKCGLREIQYLRVIDPWLAVTKGTPFTEMFKIGTKRLQEHGLQQRENHLLYEKRPKCTGRQANFVSVSMVDCYPALLVLTYGAMAAMMIALVEIMMSRKHEVLIRLKWLTRVNIEHAH